MSTEDRQAQELGDWLDGLTEDPSLDDDVVEVVGVFRPEHVPAPNLDIDALLASVSTGPLAAKPVLPEPVPIHAPALHPANRPYWAWMIPMIAAAAVFVFTLQPIHQPDSPHASDAAVVQTAPSSPPPQGAPAPKPAAAPSKVARAKSAQTPTPEVRALLDARQLEIAQCFLDASQGQPHFAGTVTLTWTVEPGAPTSVRTQQNSTGSRRLATCIEAVLSDIAWPDSAAGTWSDVWTLNTVSQ